MKTDNQTKIDVLKHLKTSFLNYLQSHKGLSSLHDSLSDYGLEPSEFFAHKFPFQSSFDDYNVRDWVNANVRHIDLTIELLTFNMKSGFEINGASKSDYPDAEYIYPKGYDALYIVERGDGEGIYIARMGDCWMLNYGDDNFICPSLDIMTEQLRHAFVVVHGDEKVN
jgi:hypothetical protein